MGDNNAELCKQSVKKCIETYRTDLATSSDGGGKADTDCIDCIQKLANPGEACVAFNKQYTSSDHTKFVKKHKGEEEPDNCFWPHGWDGSVKNNHCDINTALTNNTQSTCEEALYNAFKTLPAAGDNNSPGCDIHQLAGLIVGDFCKDAKPPAPSCLADGNWCEEDALVAANRNIPCCAGSICELGPTRTKGGSNKKMCVLVPP